MWRLEYSVITNDGSMWDPHMERGLNLEIYDTSAPLKP